MNRKVFFAALLLLAGLMPKAWADNFWAPTSNGDSLWCSTQSDGTVWVINLYGYYSHAGNLVIPDSVTYNGVTYPVSKISNSAFNGCEGLTSVTIPNTVTEIGQAAFHECSGLTSIVIGNSVTTIGNMAFDGCSSLTSITLPNSVTTIGTSTFNNCSGLTSITIPSSIVTIGPSAFSGCSGITSVVFNADSCTSVTGWGDPVFADSPNITSISIGDNVKCIPAHLFDGCSGVTSGITISTAVKIIGDDAFKNCTGLTSVTFNAENCTSMGNHYTSAFNGCTGITTVTIGSGVKSIPQFAFNGCTGLTSVTYNADSCTSMGNISDPVFANCTNMTTLTIGSNVKCIPQYAFRNCTGLTTLYFNADSCIYLGTYSQPMFQGCTNLVNITIGANVKAIPDYSFGGCSGLATITIPSAIKTIGKYAFKDCSGLTSVVFNADSCTQMGHLYYVAFENCSNLATVTFGSNVKCIPANAFCYCTGLTSVTIPNTVVVIGDDAFNYTGLTSINIPGSVTTIGSSAFMNCAGLTTATIGNAVTTIGDQAFYGCTNLTSLTMGNAVESIGEEAFFNCDGLTSLTLPNSLITIGERAFEGCDGLTSVQFGNSLATIGDYAFAGLEGLTSLVLPNSVDSIGNYAFYGCSGLTSANIPNALTFLGSNAFNGCSGLTSVTIPNTLTTISGSAFFSCSGLTSIVIGDSVTTIGSDAFYGCSGVTSLTIPDAVTTLGLDAFYGCTSLDTLIVGSGLSSINNYTFSGDTISYLSYNCPANILNYIVRDSIKTLVIGESVTTSVSMSFSSLANLYWNAVNMADFAYGMSPFASGTNLTVVFGDLVQRVPKYAFTNCTNLTSVTLGSSIEEIDYYAFKGCTGLIEISFPESLTQIGADAFNGCSGLTSLTIPASVASIGGSAFKGCTGLTSVVYNADSCDFNSSVPFGTGTSIITLDSLTIGNSVRYFNSNFYANLQFAKLIYDGDLQDWLDIKMTGSSPTVMSHNLYIADTLMTRLVIPEGIDTINANFRGDSALTYITIPSTATFIDGYAFNGCAPLWFYFKAAVPPTLENSQAFIYTVGSQSYGSWMMVPWQSLQAYKTATNYTTFAQNLLYPDSCMLTVNINDNTLGTATLDGSATLSHLYPLLDSATVVVNSNTHYHPSVQVDGCTLTSSVGNTYKVRFNRNNSYPTVQVDFLPDTHHVVAVANVAAYGTVTGTNDYGYGDPVTVVATAADGYYFVRWADGSVDNPATFVCTGDTTVTAVFSPIVTPELCMVTVQNDRNILLWNREELPIASYTIYREGATAGQYDAIATIPYAEAGAFTDTASRPLNRSYRYRLTATDTYGNESEPGGVHKTMHLTISRGVGNTWNLVWTEYEGASYTTYVIYRGTDASNIQQIDVLPSGGNTTYSDPDAPAGNVYYQVGVMMSNPCGDAPTLASKSTNISLSNIASSEDSGIGIAYVDDAAVSVYPNPTTGRLTFGGAEVQSVEVYDATGRLVLRGEHTATLDLGDLPQGLYTLRLTLADGIALRRVVKR